MTPSTSTSNSSTPESGAAALVVNRQRPGVRWQSSALVEVSVLGHPRLGGVLGVGPFPLVCDPLLGLCATVGGGGASMMV